MKLAIDFTVCVIAWGVMTPGSLTASGCQEPDARTGCRLPDPRGMLRHWLERIAAQQLSIRDEAVARIRTREQFEARRRVVRETFLRMIGELPGERGPLNVRWMGRLDRGEYRVEKIVYESLPNFHVTANLYVPRFGKGPYPAVLHPTGHSVSAKNRAFYQELSIGLARRGFIVLTYDPLGQGERRIFYDRDLNESKVGSSTAEHTMVGIQNILAGESIARYQIWDGIRGIDVLESLPYVDRARIGVTGCSGGGTLTVYITALDDRVRAAAPSCYVSSWAEQIKETGPQDAEQQFPGQLLAGMDHADLVALAAPKPYLICSTAGDYFPLEGARKTYREVKGFYDLLGAGDQIAWFVEPGGHGIFGPGREAVYSWMGRWLGPAPSGTAVEAEIRTEYEEDLNCTQTGQVATSLGGETASSINIKRLGAIAPERPELRSEGELAHFRAKVKDEAVRLTRLSVKDVPLNVRSCGITRRTGYRLERVLYDSAGGLVVPAYLCHPDVPRSPPRSVIAVDEAGKESATAPGGNADTLARSGYTVLVPDLSGTGETAPNWGTVSKTWFGDWQVASLALMVGRPLVGIRINDIIRALDLLNERNLLAQNGCLGVGRGLPVVDLLHAAAIDARFAAAVLEGGLISYSSVVRSPTHRRIFDAVVPGVLGRYDLVDLVAAMTPRPVWLVGARLPMGHPARREEVASEYHYAAEAYRIAGVPSEFRIRTRRETESILDACDELR